MYIYTRLTLDFLLVSGFQHIKGHGQKEGWYDGESTVVSAFVVIVVSTVRGSGI